MATPNVLITGATGFIGFQVLVSLLKEGYTVRAAVRSISQSESLISHPKINQYLGIPDKLSFVEVPDITREGAYDEAIKGVTYVIHLASPLPSPLLDPQTEIYEPNVKSITAILHSAHHEPSVKKVTVTASALSNLPSPPDPALEITPQSRAPNIPGPYASHVPAYIAGKTASLNATDEFINANKPSFAVVNVFLSFALGRDDRAKSVAALAAGSNALTIGVFTGKSVENPFPSAATHIDDAASIHILALKDGVTGNIGVLTRIVFDDAWDIVQKHFPRAVADGTFTRGSQPTMPVNWSTRQTEVEFGLRVKTYEDMVVDVARQYLELSGKDQA